MALGVVLAGGSSLRMGSDKALVEIAGRPMVEWVADALSAVCESVLVVGREGHLAGYRCLPDAWPVRGPLTGLATALGLDEQVIAVGVDQPFVRIDTLRQLAGEPGTLVPFDEQRQVTCAAYASSLRADAEQEAEGNGSIQSLLDRVPFRQVEDAEWRSWGEDGRSWFSVDTQQDITEGLARWGTPG
jgi:molybdopterin-guanine dinucleotide biosynthesis protein A